MPNSACLRRSRSPRAPDGLGVVQDAGRVVGGIDEDDLGAGRQRCLDGRQVEIEARVGRHHVADALVVVGVEVVFDEVGGKNHHLVAGIEEGFEHHVEAPGGADHHGDVLGRKGDVGFAPELFGHRGTRLGVTGVRHVAVHARRRLADQPVQRLVKLGGRLDHRVAQREVVDAVGPVFLLEPDAFFEHAADPGRRLHVLPNLLRDGHAASLVGLASGAAPRPLSKAR